MVNAFSMRLALVIAFGLIAAPLAAAAPIVYSFSGVATGTIGARQFTNAPYVITLIGDTTAIDIGLRGLAVWSNAVTGKIKVGNRRAAITEPIVITTACGTGMGYIGIERAPRSIPSPGFIYRAQGVPRADCVLDAAAPASGLPVNVSAFTNVQSTKGPIAFTSSSPVTYEAKLCTRPGRRACRTHGAQFRHRRLGKPAD